MVIPVVVIGDVIIGRFVAENAFGKSEKVAFPVVPEVVVAEGDIGRLFAVQSAVAFGLVGIGTGISVKEVVVVNPDVGVVLL